MTGPSEFRPTIGVGTLKLLENGAARHGGGTPMAGYDFRWMWEELHLAHLRR